MTRRRVKIIGAMCALALSGIAPALHAEDTPTAATPDASPAKPATPRRICKDVSITGSHVPRSTCHTAEEWADIKAANARNGSFADGSMQRANLGSTDPYPTKPR